MASNNTVAILTSSKKDMEQIFGKAPSSKDVVSYFENRGLVTVIALGQDVNTPSLVVIQNASPHIYAQAFAERVERLPKRMALGNKRGGQFGWGFSCMAKQGMVPSINKCIVPYVLKNSAKDPLGIALQEELLKPTLQWMWEQTQEAFPVESGLMLSQIHPQYHFLETGFSKVSVSLNIGANFHYDEKNMEGSICTILVMGKDFEGGEQVVAHENGCTVIKHGDKTLFMGDYKHLYHGVLPIVYGKRVAIIAYASQDVRKYCEHVLGMKH